jgi:hypothetical protein
MKKIFFVILFFSIKITFACDICGGVGGNATIGMFASTQFHMFGIKSNFQSYQSRMNGIIHSKEFIFRNELNFRFQMNKHLQVISSLPYQYSFQIRDLGRDQKFGIGDPFLLVNGIFLHKKDSSGSTRHFLSGSIGLKSPLGKFSSPQSSLMNMYPGTGSWDGLFLIQFVKGFKQRWSSQNEVSFALKTANKYGYRYGDVFQISSNILHNHKLAWRRMIESVGFIYTHFEPSTLNNQTLNEFNNQGNILMLKSSLHLITFNWILGVNATLPIAQKINNGSVKQTLGAEISCTYLLTTKNKNK